MSDKRITEKSQHGTLPNHSRLDAVPRDGVFVNGSGDFVSEPTVAALCGSLALPAPHLVRLKHILMTSLVPPLQLIQGPEAWDP